MARPPYTPINPADLLDDAPVRASTQKLLRDNAEQMRVAVSPPSQPAGWFEADPNEGADIISGTDWQTVFQTAILVPDLAQWAAATTFVPSLQMNFRLASRDGTLQVAQTAEIQLISLDDPAVVIPQSNLPANSVQLFSQTFSLLGIGRDFVRWAVQARNLGGDLPSNYFVTGQLDPSRAWQFEY